MPGILCKSNDCLRASKRPKGRYLCSSCRLWLEHAAFEYGFLIQGRKLTKSILEAISFLLKGLDVAKQNSRCPPQAFLPQNGCDYALKLKSIRFAQFRVFCRYNSLAYKGSQYYHKISRPLQQPSLQRQLVESQGAVLEV